MVGLDKMQWTRKRFATSFLKHGWQWDFLCFLWLGPGELSIFNNVISLRKSFRFLSPFITDISIECRSVWSVWIKIVIEHVFTANKLRTSQMGNLNPWDKWKCCLEMVTFAIWEFLHKVCPAGPEKDNAVHKRDIRPDPSLLDHHHCHKHDDELTFGSPIPLNIQIQKY